MSLFVGCFLMFSSSWLLVDCCLLFGVCLLLFVLRRVLFFCCLSCAFVLCYIKVVVGLYRFLVDGCCCLGVYCL